MYTIELSGKEIDLLFEALEVWEKQPSGDALFTSLVGGMLASSSEERDMLMNESMEEGQSKVAMRKRSSILLKAKLIQAMDECAIDGLFNAQVTTDERP